MITGDAEYCIIFSRSQRIFCLSLHYNGWIIITIVFLMLRKYINFRQTILKKLYPLGLETISKDFAANNIKKRKKKGLNGHVYHFSLHYNIIDNDNIINILKYLMKNHNIK